MEAIQNQAPRTLHPVIWVAAVSVIVFSLVGIGALSGLIPTSSSQPAAEKQSTMPPQLAAMPQAPAGQEAGVQPKVIEEYEQPAAAAAPKSAPLRQSAPQPTVRNAEPKPASHTAAKPAPLRMAQAPVEDRAPAMPAAEPARAPVICNACGVVSSVRTIEHKGEGSGVGAVGGAVAGGVLGHQMGGGRGRDVMTVVGAIAGGFGGHEVEKQVRKVVKHQVTVRFDDGSTRSFTYDKRPMFRNGDQVRLSNGELVIDNR